MKILQKQALRVAGRIFRHGNLAHAWLLAGQEGTGKEELARVMAGLLMCDRPLLDQEYVEPCGVCVHCNKLSRGTHPDLIVTEPEGAFIKLHQIHSLQKAIAYPPLEARNRAVLLLHAHRMNREAANALLKTLEEPPDRTFLILTASSMNSLLPTTVSRCQIISCGGIETADIASVLVEEGIAQEQAVIAAALSGGSLSWARLILDRGLSFRDLFMKFLSLTPMRRISLLFDLVKVMSESVDDFMLSVAVIRAVVRDMLLLKTCNRAGDGVVDRFINQDISVEIMTIASQFSMEQLDSYAKRLEEMERLSARNINRKMLSMALMVFWIGQCEGKRQVRYGE